MTRVLSVIPRMNYPAVSGGEIRLDALMRHLSGRYRFTVLAFAAEPIWAAQAALGLEVERRHGIRIHLVRRSGPEVNGSGWLDPEIARAHHDPKMAEAIRRVAAEEKPDIIHLEFTQMAQYASAARGLAPVVYTEHDASILAWGLSYLRPPNGGGWWARALEWARHHAHLRSALRLCDRVVAVSEADARRLAPLAGAGKVRVVPTGVELGRFPFRGLEGREPGLVLYVGHYAHYPNEDAALALARRVMPALRKLVPAARLSLVGSGVTSRVAALASAGVEVVGEVPEVQPHLARARVFVAPIRLGFGIKGKLLEAFASGAPVVATPRSCEAMPGLEDGVHLLLGDSPEALARQAARIIGDEALSRRLARAARDYVAERFGWERQAALLDGVYQEALGAEARAR